MGENEEFRAIGQQFGFLSQYAIQTRYSHDIQINENITRRCLKYAEHKRDFALIAGLRESPTIA